MKKFILVNKVTEVPIRAVGLCSGFINEADAIKTRDNWNRYANPSNLVKVKEICK